MEFQRSLSTKTKWKIVLYLVLTFMKYLMLDSAYICGFLSSCFRIRQLQSNAAGLSLANYYSYLVCVISSFISRNTIYQNFESVGESFILIWGYRAFYFYLYHKASSLYLNQWYYSIPQTFQNENKWIPVNIFLFLQRLIRNVWQRLQKWEVRKPLIIECF